MCNRRRVFFDVCRLSVNSTIITRNYCNLRELFISNWRMGFIAPRISVVFVNRFQTVRADDITVELSIIAGNVVVL